MATYTIVCDQGHPAETMSAQADSDDEAVEKLFEMGTAHNKEAHGGTPMSDDDFRAYIKANMTQS